MSWWSGVFGVYGTQEAVTSWSIGGVNLPYGPEGIRLPASAQKESVNVTASLPINIYDGLKDYTITLTGTIANPAMTDAELWSDIILSLQALIGTEVTLLCPITALVGEYGFDGFNVERDTKLAIYRYTMTLSKGSLNIVEASY